MRISNPRRFANRVVIPAGLTLFGLALYIDLTKTVLLKGQPVTIVFVLVPACISLWLAQVAHDLKKGKNNEYR